MASPLNRAVGALVDPHGMSLYANLCNVGIATAMTVDLIPHGSVWEKIAEVVLALIGILGMGNAHLVEPPPK